MLRRLTPLALVAVLALAGCASTPDEPEATLTPTATETTEAVACLPVGDAQAASISEGLEDGFTLSDWHALPADTGPGAWFLAAHANGPGIEDEPFVFFTAGNPEDYAGGQVLAADMVTDEFVDWPMQEGAMFDAAYNDVQACLP